MMSTPHTFHLARRIRQGVLCVLIAAGGGGCAEEPAPTHFDWGMTAPTQTESPPTESAQATPPPVRPERISPKVSQSVVVESADPITPPRTRRPAAENVPPPSFAPSSLAMADPDAPPTVIPKTRPKNRARLSDEAAPPAPESLPDNDDVVPRRRPNPNAVKPEPTTPHTDTDDVRPLARPAPDTDADTDDNAPPPPEKTSGAPKAAKGSGRFQWPADGPVVADFGAVADGQRNDGITIAVRKNAPIYAAAAGTVVYVGNGVKGYGNLMLIRHAGEYVTAYAYAARFTVKAGAKVAAGQVIGYCGQSGDIARPQLHFEVRQKVRPVDPKPFLAPKG